LKKLIIAAILILAPSAVLAAEGGSHRPHWSVELKAGAFFPDATEWSRFYDSSVMGEYGAALSYKPHRLIDVGIEGSYARAKGKGLQSQGTAGEVTFEQVPLNLFVLARAVFDENQWLVPYAGGGYTRMFYRAKVKDQGKTEGSVNGYHARAGVQLLLDRLEPETAQNLYLDFGMHHTYFFLEGRYTRAEVDTVASGTIASVSENLGGISCLGGFLFEF
jgi:opacity protein-like surface antigen